MSMRPYRGIPQTEVLPLPLEGGGLRVTITRDARIPHSAAVEAAWAKLLASNPKYFDGPILSVLHLPHELDNAGTSRNEIQSEIQNEILVRRDRFSRLAVQPAVNTGVRILSVTGVLLSKDSTGREFVLLGKRGRSTRIYGGMWELGPSGGLQDPPQAVTSLDHEAIFANLADEIAEEVGLELNRGEAVCLTRDHKAMSDDIVFICDAGPLEVAASEAHAVNWEYEEVRWLPTDSIEPFDAHEEANIIPPTRALFRALGWIETT